MYPRPFFLFLALIACDDKTKPAPDGGTDTETEETVDIPCAETDPTGMLLWGDLHAHSSWSFDAGAYGSKLTTKEAFAYAKGKTVNLPDETGDLTRSATIDRPLDFLGMTEHGEFLGEIKICTEPEWAGYSSETCERWRDAEASNGAYDFGILMADPSPTRFEDICGSGSDCEDAAKTRWQAMQNIANEANDSTEACTFTAFIAYEYTNTRDVSNLHRNVVFGTEVVPELPVTHFEASTPLALWKQLDEVCTGDCDVLVLPHNSNLSNGQLFTPDYGATDDPAEVAALRARMEPVGEIFQHKGDSECRNGFDGIDNEKECGFEKLRPPDAIVCGDETGAGGMRLLGCVHRLDFLRNTLLEGLTEEQRLGVNPYRLGFIGSTDTHNGTPGHVDSENFMGHVGVVDATPEGRLGEGTVTHDTLENNPGGLAAVWAEENSRKSIFDAVRRRETYATSGPRIALRFFASDDLPSDLCRDENRISRAHDIGQPMGSVVSEASTFFVEATADHTPLSEIQIIKGWIDDDGKTQQTVFTVAGPVDESATVDTTTCESRGEGARGLCTVWTDPDPVTNGFYYARVLENPTCRWSQRDCNSFADSDKPAGCTESFVEQVVQQRAWSSPIWVNR